MSDGSSAHIVNVIDEFDYSTQNNSYSDSFKKWRKRKENPYSFSYEENKRESVYIEGRGFLESSASAAERASITKVIYRIGLAMLLWIVVDDVIGQLVVYGLGMVGVNIHTNFFSSVIYGGSLEIAISLICIALTKILLPMLMLRLTFKLPRKAMYPSRMEHPMELIGAMSITLISCTATSLPSAYSSETKEVYEMFTGLGADVSVWSQKEFVVYTIFHIIVIPILMEFLFRGAMFTVLRQFGDMFAVVVTSVIACLLTQDVHLMPAVLLISLISSVGMLSSGTIFTAVAVNVLYRMYDLTLIILENNPTERMPLTRNIFMILALVAGIAGLGIYSLNARKRETARLVRVDSEMTIGERFLCAARTFPFSAVALLCVVSAILKVVLR